MTLARARRQLAFLCSFACLLGVALVAATPTFWTVSSQADFLKGDVEDLSIDSDGRMFLGPAASVLGETSAPFLWSIVAGADGTLWAGSGNEGKVLKIARDGKVTTFFDAPELEVHAIAAAPQGGLYVATSPDGKIYSVAADGTSKTFFDPEDKYIWALATDASGNVFAATGDKGVIYKITPDGKGARFYKAGATNVVSLATTRTGELIAGTESPGRVFRIDAAGKAFVLIDSPFREIHALRLAADGTIYAAALSATPSSGADRAAEPVAEPSRPVTPSVSTEITGMSVVEGPISSSTAPSAGRSTRRPGRGAIYRIRPDGLWDTVWETADDAPYDLIVEDGGSLLVGTGTDGKIFRLSGNPARATLLARAAARQVTALLREPSGRIVGATSNPGKVFALSSTAARKGTYESDVRDAGTVATWGAIRWRASGRAGQVQIVTRSGNTATPDETWSAWSNAYTNADGERIGSPNARYLQWRATLTSDSAQGPVLTSVTAAYLPRNLRPEVTSITVHPPGASLPAALLDRRRRDCRLRRQHLGRPFAEPDERRARRARAADPLARPPHLSEGAADVRLEGGRSERRPPAVRRLLPAGRRNDLEGPEAWPLGSHRRVGYDVGARRHLRAQDRGVGCAVELTRHVADRRAGEQQFRDRQLAAAHRAAARRSRARARSGSSSATRAPPCSAWSIRSTRAGGGRSIRRTASRTRDGKSSR